MTLAELLIASLIAGFVVIAAFAMYLHSVETWQQTTARLDVQRDASLVIDRMLKDIRPATFVDISNGNTRMEIHVRASTGADSVSAIYYLDGAELKNHANTVLLDRITSLSFSSADGEKVVIQMRLEDDLGTSAISEDDEGIRYEAVAVARN